MAVAEFTDNKIAVFYGNAGVFSATPDQVAALAGLHPNGLAIGKVTGAAAPLLISADRDSDQIDLLKRGLDGSFSVLTSLFVKDGASTQFGPVEVLAVDFASNGRAGIVTSHMRTGTLKVFKQVLPLAPLVSSPTHPDPASYFAATDARFHFDAVGPDLDGIDHFVALFDQQPATVPTADSKAYASDAEFSGLDTGTYYIHVRAVDKAGDLGDVTHFKIGVTAALSQANTYNYPNPSRDGKTTLRFALLEPTQVSLRIYDEVGALVWSKDLGPGETIAGVNSVLWDGRNDRGQSRGQWRLHPAAEGRREGGHQKNCDRPLNFSSASDLLALAGAPARARADGDAGQPGAYLREGVGARALGLGNAYVSVADGADAVFGIPQAWPSLRPRPFPAPYPHLASTARPMTPSWPGPLEKRGAAGEPGPWDGPIFPWATILKGGVLTRPASYSFGDDQNTYLLSHGRALTPWLLLGISAKLYEHRLDVFSAYGGGLDLGALILPMPGIRVGVSALDLFSPSQWNTGYVERFPLDLRVGLSAELFSKFLLLSAQATAVDGRQLDYEAGLEARYAGILAARAGIQGQGFSLGGGVNVAVFKTRLSVDYAFSPDPLGEGNIQRFSFGVFF